ncbi:MAG: hypothetical protein HOD92_24775 [Deltaproteobacteria bacterium]|jgi:hypothetical protein|nr:hypothetical protein [Deltaproteobacteria bacterium]MBT4527602.1 hypothetical protein [Deltaproteobacteria bacterium]
MDSNQFREILTDQLGFWQLEKDSNSIYTKNAPCLSVIYLLVEIVDEMKVIVSERTEKTIIGDLKYYDKTLLESDLEDSQLINRIEFIHDSYC